MPLQGTSFAAARRALNICSPAGAARSFAARRSAHAEIAAGPMIDGEDQVEDGRAQYRQCQPVGGQDQEGSRQDGQIDAELEIAGPQAEAVLKENGQDVETAKSGTVT